MPVGSNDLLDFVRFSHPALPEHSALILSSNTPRRLVIHLAHESTLEATRGSPYSR